MIDTTELRRLHSESSGGEWKVEIEEYDNSGSVIVNGLDRLLHDVEWADPEEFKQDQANANFIAAAHNAMPALCDELDAARKQLEIKDQMKMYVWSDRYSYLAVAHARSVKRARELLAGPGLLETGGDTSCPERNKARDAVSAMLPDIWIGENAEFVLTDSAEVSEQLTYSEKLKAELDALRIRVAELEAMMDGHKALSQEPPK